MNDSRGGADLSAAIPADEAEHDVLVELATPEFRAVSTALGRKGLRLEKVFWDGLSAIADGLGIRRSALVETVVGRAKRQNLNAASALRSYVAGAFADEIKNLRPLAATSYAIRLLQQAPVPSFALSRQKKLIQVNAEFMQYLRFVSGNPAANVPADVAQLSFDTPVDQLFEEIGQGAPVQCGITIRIDHTQKHATCRIVGVPPWPPVAIVGYIRH